MRPVVSLVKSRGHYEGVRDALRLIEDEIVRVLKAKNKILIKPNFVSTHIPLAASHVDAVRATLDFITQHHSGRITIAEGPSAGRLDEALENFGYLKLAEQYDISFIDLNSDEYAEVEVFDRELRPMKVRVAKSVIESDYRISVTLPKTHDVVVVTLSLKNMAVGSLLSHHKARIHQGYRAINLNIAKIAHLVFPNLGIIDGFVAMEGDGPEHGSAVDFRVAAASTYPLSLDSVVARAMGFDPGDIGYIQHLQEWNLGTADPSRVEIRGTKIEEVERKFRPHSAYREQLKWKYG